MEAIAPAEEKRLTVEIAELWPPQGDWTEADYLRLPESNRLVELSEGEIEIMPPPSFAHQRALDNIYYALKTYVHEHQLGETAFAPIAVRLWPGKIREPDAVLYLNEHRERIGEFISGIPDLVVEVVSPSSRQRDRHDKFHEYAAAGVQEYWIVDPEAETVEVFYLEDGAYSLHVQAQGTDPAGSRLLDKFIITPQHLFV